MSSPRRAARTVLRPLARSLRPGRGAGRLSFGTARDPSLLGSGAGLVLLMLAMLVTSAFPASAAPAGPAPGSDPVTFTQDFAQDKADRAVADPVGTATTEATPEAIGNDTTTVGYVACWQVYEATEQVTPGCELFFTAPGSPGPANQKSDAANTTAATDAAGELANSTLGLAGDAQDAAGQIAEDPTSAPGVLTEFLGTVVAFAQGAVQLVIDTVSGLLPSIVGDWVDGVLAIVQGVGLAGKGLDFVGQGIASGLSGLADGLLSLSQGVVQLRGLAFAGATQSFASLGNGVLATADGAVQLRSAMDAGAATSVSAIGKGLGAAGAAVGDGAAAAGKGVADAASAAGKAVSSAVQSVGHAIASLFGGGSGNPAPKAPTTAPQAPAAPAVGDLLDKVRGAVPKA